MRPYYPGNRALCRRREHPFPLDNVVRFDTMYVETGRFLRQTMRDIQIAGGRIEVRDFATPPTIAGLPEKLVFNCTGLGARDLFGDQELASGARPARDPAAAARGALRAAAEAPGYMFPRADGIILGGTFERDVWDRQSRPGDDRAASSRRHQALLRRIPLHRLNSLRRASNLVVMNYQAPRATGT